MEILEAAELLQVSQKQINTWIEEGKLEVCHITGISNRMVVVPPIIPEFLAEQAQRNDSSELVIKAPQPLDSPAPRNDTWSFRP